MRRESAPTGLRLAVFLLFAANLKTSTSQYISINRTAFQEHLVCKKPDSHSCVTWHLGPVDPDIIIEESPSNATQFCGLSDLKRILPHRKFITVKSLTRDGKSKIIFCKGFTKLKGSIVNWKQVEKTLNALSRSRRQTAFVPRGRYKGQTQSQYLAIDRGNGKDEGKAEAHSAADSSRASVSGNSGMGQAQSQSMYDPDCDDCYGKSYDEVESLKRGPYVPGGVGNKYAPADGYRPSGSYAPENGYRPGQGNNYGPHQQGAPVDITKPGTGYGPDNGGNSAYGPSGQQGGSGGYRPGPGSGPGTSSFGPSSGTIPGVTQGVNGGYGPVGGRPGTAYGPSLGISGSGQGGNGGYGPSQGSGPGSGYGPSSGTTPGSGPSGNGIYRPGQGSGPGSSYGPTSGTTSGGGPGGNGGYGPNQGSGPSSGYGPSSGTTPGSGPSGNGIYRPGQGSGPGSSYGPSSGTTSGGGPGGNGGYGPNQGSGPSSGYGPSSGTTPGSGPSGNGIYRPGQGSGPGSSYGPSSGTTSEGGPGGNGGYGPSQGSAPGSNYGHSSGTTPGSGHGGNGGYGPSQGSGPGSSYRPSTGTAPGSGQGQNGGYAPGPSGTLGGDQGGNAGYQPGGQQGGSGGYGPTQGRGQHTGYTPGQHGGNGVSNYGTDTSLNGPGSNFGGNRGPGFRQDEIPAGNIYNQGQGGSPSGGFQPGQGGIGGYPPNQGPLTSGGYKQEPSVIPGSNIQLTPGGPGYGRPNSGIPSNIGYTPGQGNQNYIPGQLGTSGSGIDPNKLTGSNWPLALGPYPGPPGSSIYCCVVPNNYAQNVGTGGNIFPSTGNGYPSNTGIGGSGNGLQTPYGSKTNSAPSNLYGPVYGTSSDGSPNLQGPNSYNTGLPQGTNILQTPGTYNKVGGPGASGGLGGINGMNLPGNLGTGLPGGPGDHNKIVGPGGQFGIQGPGNFGAGPSGGPGYNGIQGPGNFGTGSPGISDGQKGIQGPGNFDAGPNSGSGQNGMQRPGNFGTGPSSGLGQNAVQGPGNFGTGSSGGLGGQNGMQGPGNFGSGPSGGLGVQNGMQGPGNFGAGVIGGPGQSGLQEPGNFGVGAIGRPGQSGLQGPGNFGAGPYGGPGSQYGMHGPGNFGTDPSSGTGSQTGTQGPGNFGVGPSGGPGQNEMAGPGNFGTGSSVGPGGQSGIQGPGNFGAIPSGGTGQNGMAGPGNFGAGSSGGPGGQNGMHEPGNFGAGPTSGLGQNGMQGPVQGNYGPEIFGGSPGAPGTQSGLQAPGTPGTQNGLQAPGTYGNLAGPGGQSGIQRPGNYATDSSGPNNQYGMQGQNIPNNQGGVGQNTGLIGGPGIYGGQHETSGSGHSGRPSGNQQGYDNQGNPLPGNEYNGIPQNFVDPNSIAIDGDDSEAEAIVNQAANGTTASASSKGGNDKGRAQTHVHGTYTGGGSFQAQAQITGENKEAGSEVSGGSKGASSSATGSGRNNKSQASVQLGSETGSVQTQSQSNGAMHSSNSQVQGSVKGGMSDAQARGPGSTSSQAQIGFTPYKDGEKAHELIQTPFVGGGIASAQSSGRTGQSQSQLHGTFKYGITYNGAAQAGASLDKDAVFPNRLNFEKINVFDDSQKNINVDMYANSPNDITSTESSLLEVPLETKTNTSNDDEMTTEKPNDETMKNSESRYLSHNHLDHHKTDTTPAPSLTAVSSRRSFHSGYENTGADYEYTTDKDEIPPEEYDTDPGYGVEGNDATDVDQTVGEEFSNYDEYNRDYQTHQSLQSPHRKGLEVQQSTGGNTQHIVLGSINNHDAHITQRNSEKPDESKLYQPGERVPGTGGYRIPIGFTGSVKSVSSKENTYVVGSKHFPSQAQTVTLTPGSGKVNYVHPQTNGKYISPKDLKSLKSQNPHDDRYVSVSKSVTRALDGENNIRKQYSHTYYTKSSSCGYFTFTCTMVSGADGKKKVCKPKMPTNPDGTPIRC